jgi:uncharacterized membrane protein HdeD (DUF308 family)
MSKSLSIVFLVLGVLLIIFGLIAHLAMHALIFPHFSLVVGAVAVILAGIGVYGYMTQGAKS